MHKKKRKPKPSTIRRRRLYQTRKQSLISFLGGICVDCGSTKKLTFDHISGERNWNPHEVHATKRLRIYLEEAERGLIQLLCSSCNSAKGNSPEDDDTF